MAYTSADTSKPSYFLGSKLKDIERCSSELSAEDANKLDALKADILEIYANPPVAPAEAPKWDGPDGILAEFERVATVRAAVTDIDEYLTAFEDRDAFCKPKNAMTKQQRVNHAAISQCSITLCENVRGLSFQYRDCLPDYYPGLWSIRNKCAHVYRSLLSNQKDPYSASKHYTWLKKYLPTYQEISSLALDKTIATLKQSIAFEVGNWDTEFRQVADEIERNKVADSLDHQEHKAELASANPCECEVCKDPSAWDICKNATPSFETTTDWRRTATSPLPTSNSAVSLSSASTFCSTNSSLPHNGSSESLSSIDSATTEPPKAGNMPWQPPQKRVFPMPNSSISMDNRVNYMKGSAAGDQCQKRQDRMVRRKLADAQRAMTSTITSTNASTEAVRSTSPPSRWGKSVLQLPRSTTTSAGNAVATAVRRVTPTWLRTSS